nr:probable acyl-activating enzyme 6 [Ipomoea batatas]
MALLTKATAISPCLFVFSPTNVGNIPAGMKCKPTTPTKCATMNSFSPASEQITEIAAPKKTPRPGRANSCPLTPVDFLERAATVYGDCPSVVYNDTAYTWSETHERCLRLASSIWRLGIGKNDVVSVLAPNIPAMYELHFAAPMAGAILNTINLRLDARTVSIQLLHSSSKLVFVDRQSSSLVLEAISLLPTTSLSQRPILILISDDEESDFRGFHDCYENMVRGGDPGFSYVGPESEWDPIALNYTSGTTSSPKGVLYSHRAAFSVTFTSLLHWWVPRQPVYLWTLPMFHANGWSYTWGMAAVGGTNVCLRRVDPASINDAIEKHGVTHMCGAPVVLNMLANYNCANRKPLASPVDILTAGAPPPAAVLERVESLGFRVSHGYGLTETGGLAVTCAWKREWDNLPAPERAAIKSRQGVRSVGFAGVDVVHPHTGKSVKRDGNMVGEIVLRGNSIMLGYLKDPEGTSKCMKEDGWFYTGDVGVVHPDGYIEVKDRLKDVIICGGENLSSVEVESVLYMHPAVDEAAVVARPDKFWGETPCAFVSLKKGMMAKPTEKEMREFCKERLPLFMVPRKVVFMAALPKTSTGKIQKFLLRDLSSADMDANQSAIGVEINQGHMNLMVHLSRLIASYDLPVYFVGLSVDIAAVKRRIEGWTPSDYPKLRFHDFPEPPGYLSNTNPTAEGQSYVDFQASAMNAAAYLRRPVGDLLEELSAKCERLVVVNDALMINAVKDVAASAENMETYNFYVGSAFHDASLVWEVLRKALHFPSFLWKFVGKFILPAGAVIPDRLPIPSTCFPPEFFKFIVDQRQNHHAFCKGNIYDSCRAIEGPYLDLLAMVYKLARKGPVWGIGPFNPVVTKQNTKSDEDSSSRHPCLKWLDKQPPKSVIFVSFGTQTILSDPQLYELAEGLEQSGQRFIWVVKDLTKGYKNTQIKAPAGFEQRIEGRGLILQDWVPQLEILDHVSTGGFLTHCGWNSGMESMCRGVPLATWPIQYDQPRNAILITEVLKTGIAIKDWERRDEIITSTTISNAIRRLMASQEGEDMRTKAAQVGKAVKESVMEGGISRLEMDDFIAQITR